MKTTLSISAFLIICVIIGIFIYYTIENKSISSPIGNKFFQQTPTAEPTPTLKPTLSPLDKNSNLEEEINKLIPEDFSESFNNLKQEL